MKGDHVEMKAKRQRSAETKPREMLEKKLEREIIIALKMVGCDVGKCGEQSTYNSNFVLEGMSDLIVFIHKCVLFMEVKQECHRNEKNGGLRDTQVRFKSICEKCGLRYVVVYNKSEALEAVR